ncbi:hypothetical protein ISN45_Aa08g029100 [Arabidopsis thaliana x Arabidopsis arenosa]|uniref:Uncharacterized protein n=1 Tax=Arabidopsis thaliana x Arabidopsis arenosa TaxID=1240361 RepID=A0A8T1XSG6_9BRAS|nr:hypothetical protein ISN45_Aa08g029100 [Arabidopsis thaliana x Arabidopsis arenosa]
MGNCAIKPKVLKDSDEDLVPVERETAVPADHDDKDPAEKSENIIAPNAEEEAAAAARRSEKGKEILIEDDVDDHHKRPSLSHLFHEDKTVVEKEVTDVTPTKPDTNNKTSPFSEISKLDTTALGASNVKDSKEPFDVQTRNDLEVKIPKDSDVKTPDTPKAKEAEENFSDNWEVKFPEELEAKKTSEAVKVAEESKLPETYEVSAPELSEIKVTKGSNVPEVLVDKNIPEVPEVKSDEVKVAESELLKVSEVESTEDLEIKVPKVFEAKTPETSNVKVTDEAEVKTDQRLEVEVTEEKEVPEFVDAKEKIEISDQDKEIVLPKTEEEEKDVSLEKQVKESTLSDLGNK